MESARFWSQKEIIVALAWLDFCKENALSYEDTVVGRLKDASGSKLTLLQVKNKLTYLWRGCPPSRPFIQDPTRPNHTCWKEIQEKGTSCLLKWPDGTKKPTERLLDQYRAENAIFEFHKSTMSSGNPQIGSPVAHQQENSAIISTISEPSSPPAQNVSIPEPEKSEESSEYSTASEAINRGSSNKVSSNSTLRSSQYFC
jgi:hypothetical protein